MEATLTKAEILERNRLEYDDAADLYWRLTVYDAVHSGWWFANIGGHHVLDLAGNVCGLTSGSYVLDLCCGLGDTSRYLAQCFECRVTGADINPRQLEKARLRQHQVDPVTAERIKFVEADVHRPLSPSRFDAVLLLDSLMLVERRIQVLQNAYDSLKPGGRLVLADVFVGPCVTNAAIRFIRIEDGIVNLPSGDMQLSTLDSLGFSSYSNWDLSHLATDCFQRMLVATQQFKDVLIPTKGRHRYDRWRRNARIYRSLFRRRQLTYLIIIAVRS